MPTWTRAWSQRTYAERKASGLCAKCGCANDRDGRLICAFCQRKIRWQRAERRKVQSKPSRQDYKHAWYAERKASGRCVQCGLPNDRLPRVSCTACGQRQAKQYRDKTGGHADNDGKVVKA